MKAALTTLGCRLNQADTAALAAILKEAGYQIIPWQEVADLYLINTCTVTAGTDQQSRQAIRRAHRANPSALIIATGCYAQVDPGAIASIEGVDLVLGNREKLDLKSYLQDLAKGGRPRIAVGDLSQGTLFQDRGACEETPRTRPLLKVQEGCSGECTYCIVPRARGPERSLPPAQVKDKLVSLLARGFKEVVLTGTRLGAYGQDLAPRANLSELLSDLLLLPGTWRLRLSSLEPHDISPHLVSALQELPRLCRHLHLPLQSGDDEILALMGRTDRVEGYRSLLQDLAAGLPGIGLGADIIVGFPGETKERFLRTFRFLEEMPLSYLHVFPFSARPGTPAATLPHAPSPQEKKDRARQLRSLGREKSLQFRSGFIGRELEVVVLRKRDRRGRGWLALSDNYLPILIQDRGEEGIGQLVSIVAEGMDQDLLLGRRKE